MNFQTRHLSENFQLTDRISSGKQKHLYGRTVDILTVVDVTHILEGDGGVFIERLCVVEGIAEVDGGV